MADDGRSLSGGTRNIRHVQSELTARVTWNIKEDAVKPLVLLDVNSMLSSQTVSKYNSQYHKLFSAVPKEEILMKGKGSHLHHHLHHHLCENDVLLCVCCSIFLCSSAGYPAPGKTLHLQELAVFLCQPVRERHQGLCWTRVTVLYHACNMNVCGCWDINLTEMNVSLSVTSF